MGNYDDIIHLPHHVSSTRPHMSRIDRAAQFQPFRALTGYEDAVWETARQTQARVELTDEEKARLDGILQTLADSLGGRPQVVLTYFQPDKKKTGGAYVTTTGQLKQIDDVDGVLILLDGERIVIEDLLDIQVTVPS